MLPIVATLLSSGLSLLGNAVLAKGQDVIEDKLGVKLDDLVKTDEGKIKLKQIEADREADLHQFILLQREQELRDQKMAYDDTADARNREAKIATSAEAPTLNKIITPVLAMGIILCTFLLFALVMFGAEITPTRKDIVIYILGVLSALSTQIVAYYFGSSKGSAAKDETIQAMQGMK